MKTVQQHKAVVRI